MGKRCGRSSGRAGKRRIPGEQTTENYRVAVSFNSPLSLDPCGEVASAFPIGWCARPGYSSVCFPPPCGVHSVPRVLESEKNNWQTYGASIRCRLSMSLHFAQVSGRWGGTSQECTPAAYRWCGSPSTRSSNGGTQQWAGDLWPQGGSRSLSFQATTAASFARLRSKGSRTA
jgi:hypothetical protein